MSTEEKDKIVKPKGILLQKVNYGQGPRKLKIDFGDDSLNITYARDKYTPALEKQLKETMDQGLPGGVLARMLEAMVIEWDIIMVHPEDVNKPDREKRYVPLPVVAKDMEDNLSIEAMGRIMEMIGEDNRPNRTNSAPQEFSV